MILKYLSKIYKTVIIVIMLYEIKYLDTTRVHEHKMKIVKIKMLKQICEYIMMNKIKIYKNIIQKFRVAHIIIDRIKNEINSYS